MSTPTSAKREVQPRRLITVRVPATSANIGAGYDCLGMALDIWNELTVERAAEFEVIIEGEGSQELPRDERNLVCVGVKAAFKAAGIDEVPTLKYHLKNAIPFARGLGSSSAAIVAGIVAGLRLCDYQLPVEGEEALLQIAAGIEGHPDNVAPALYGGLQIGFKATERWHTDRVRIPAGLQCIVFSPDFGSETSEARGILGDQVSREDCVFNMARVGLLINAFCTGNLDALRFAVDDALHQPQRSALFPHLYPMIKAAHDAGAHGWFLSGAGPSVMAICSGAKGDVFSQHESERRDAVVANAMIEAAKKVGVTGRVFMSNPTEKGAHVVKADPPFSAQTIRTFAPGSWTVL